MVAANYIHRPRQLRSLQVGLQMLETEINYTGTSLPEALERVAARLDEPIASLFRRAAEDFLQGDGDPFAYVWEDVWQGARDLLALSSQDGEILQNLGQVIGRSDLDDQLKHLSLIRAQLHQEERAAIEERDRNVKLWNYLGFAGGLALVLLFY
jgi:stage III sporulation protein AB